MKTQPFEASLTNHGETDRNNLLLDFPAEMLEGILSHLPPLQIVRFQEVA